MLSYLYPSETFENVTHITEMQDNEENFSLKNLKKQVITFYYLFSVTDSMVLVQYHILLPFMSSSTSNLISS